MQLYVCRVFKNVFSLTVFETKAPLCVVAWTKQFNNRHIYLNHNEEKSFKNIPSSSRYLYYRKKNPYHIYWLCFHFPLGESIVMRKEMKEDCFLPSALSTQLILLGGQISAVPGRGEEKMSLINQKQNDQWPVSAAMRNRGCEQHSTAYHSSPNEGRMTSTHRARAVLDACPWLLWEMEHAASTREAYLESL